ncbi:MAG TPA: hypothetical protein VMT00_02695 [Thermoanaerobaculia bacterium]|nr:hypothetical protein [Thermoanaerobaculia bacterium]
MSRRKDGALNRLRRMQGAAPPHDLQEKIKQGIPDRFVYRNEPAWISPSTSWRAAAAVILLVGFAYVTLRIASTDPALDGMLSETPRASTASREAPLPELRVAETDDFAPVIPSTSPASIDQAGTPELSAGRTKDGRLGREAAPGPQQLALRDDMDSPAAPPVTDRAENETSGAEPDRQRIAEAPMEKSDPLRRTEQASESESEGVAGAAIGGVRAETSQRAAAKLAPAAAASPSASAFLDDEEPRRVRCKELEAVELPAEATACVLRVAVDARGTVDRTTLLKSGGRMADRLAERAVRNCTFRRVSVDGKEVRTTLTATVRFDPVTGISIEWIP